MLCCPDATYEHSNSSAGADAPHRPAIAAVLSVPWRARAFGRACSESHARRPSERAPAAAHRTGRRCLAGGVAARCQAGHAGLPRPPTQRSGDALQRLRRGRLLAAALGVPARPSHRRADVARRPLGPCARLGAGRRSPRPAARWLVWGRLRPGHRAAAAAPELLPKLLARARLRHVAADGLGLVGRVGLDPRRRGCRHDGGGRAALCRLPPCRRALVALGSSRQLRVVGVDVARQPGPDRSAV